MEASDIPPVIAECQSEPLSPITASDRIETLDVLRGFALLGILTVNMAGFSWPMDMAITQRQFSETRPDLIIDWIAQFFAEGKFYPLFSFLFGLGTAIQMQRADARETKFAGRFCRRLFVLLAFGLVHALFVWEGDILVWYAVCGFLLLPFRKRQPKTILIWAVVCLLIPVLFITLIWAILVIVSLSPELAAKIQNVMAEYSTVSDEQFQETIRIFATGSYAEMFKVRVGNLIYGWMMGVVYLPEFLSLFLFGLYVGKQRILHDVEANVTRIRCALICGLVIGVPANLFYTLSMARSDLSDAHYLWLLSYAFATLGGPLQSFAYAAAITLLLRQELWTRLLHPVGVAGRIALTNYLMQSLICTTIFYSYGLGLFGAVGRTMGLGLAVLIYVTQLGFSLCWLNYFRFGPMEWLWRTLTYGKLQPMRR